ncbi:FAD-binding protein [Metabacillus hrfriensis]|uniref:FAD-binding oxidoreductase n=1 Tax=Metabacillus hrfriensis TaxID=3048891 RepID=A0ACD4RG09_9BACI|nr:FAD-binding oxidoreductase [Metabacillus sp. CT-WN-B3]WHZ59322.1 FAD-binding oxidoreductase [Metabacillus sp. CT-WN-B3]
MKKRYLMLLTLGFIIVFACSLKAASEEEKNDPLIMTDVSGLMPIKIDKVIKGKEIESFKKAIKEARETNKKISIAGKQHSQGGHTYYKDAIVLDMTSYNKILDFDKENKTITVQSGATWDDIQRYVNPHGLAVKVMQSQNIFTVGGSMSVNVHGRDIRHGSLIDSIQSFRLLNADGEIVRVSRTENEKLFPLVIGGYGLFGVILDAEISLTDDELYVMKTKALDYKEYADYFKQAVRGNEKVRMHFARLSTAPDSFLSEMYVTNYELAGDQGARTEYDELSEEKNVALMKFLLGLSRNYDWGKNAFWNAQKSYFLKKEDSYITRNNVMRSESEFLEYEHETNTDILQEYFVPVDAFPDYVDSLRKTLTEEELNLFNMTIRYVDHNEDAVLSYSRDEMFAFVLLINQGLSDDEIKKTRNVIRKMIDVTLSFGGTYYLPYQPYPTKEQMKRAYPRTDEFFGLKRTYDEKEIFMNYFYEEYGRDEK